MKPVQKNHSAATAARVDCPECHSPLGPDQYNKSIQFVQDDHSTRMDLITDCDCCGLRKSNWRLVNGAWELIAVNPKKQRKKIAA